MRAAPIVSWPSLASQRNKITILRVKAAPWNEVDVGHRYLAALTMTRGRIRPKTTDSKTPGAARLSCKTNQFLYQAAEQHYDPMVIEYAVC